MTKSAPRSPSLQAYLRRFGNPYASLEIEEVPANKKKNQPQRSDRSPYVRHPYALIPQTDGLKDGKSELMAPSPHPFAGTLSKVEFRTRCRRIFRQYVPKLEKGRLRKPFRDFIARNESSSSARRYRLVMQLETYDISKHQEVTAHFNRERQTLTEKKLKQIERMVGEEN